MQALAVVVEVSFRLLFVFIDPIDHDTKRHLRPSGAGKIYDFTPGQAVLLQLLRPAQGSLLFSVCAVF